MTIIDEVDEVTYVPVDKDKLKEDQQKELREAVDQYECECLKSYNATRSGDVVKKFDFPSLQPLTEAQREKKMIDPVYQAVGQAFVKSATIMGNTLHNAVVKTFAEGTFLGCLGPCYIHPDQMNFAPLETAMAAALSAPDS